MNIPADMTSALAAQGLWYGRLCTTSSSAIILYDHLITFSDEIRLIWKSRWSAGKFLFLISRYYNIFMVMVDSTQAFYIHQLLPHACFIWLRWQAISGIFVYSVTEIILMLRLYAMYGSSRRILVVLVLGFSSVIVAEIIIVVLSTRAQIGAVNSDPHLPLPMATCILTDTWPLSYLYWLPFLAFESLLFVLALAKGAQSIREHDLELTRSFGFSYKDHGGRAAKALEVLIRDSVLYFMLIFAIFLANALAWIIDDGRIGEIPVALAVALSTVMAQRLLLNIRANFERRSAGAGTEVTDGTTGTETFALSTMIFDQLYISTSGNVEPGSGKNDSRNLERGNQWGGERTRQITTTSSIMSGSTAVSPISPFNANTIDGSKDLRTLDFDHELLNPDIRIESPHTDN